MSLFHVSTKAGHAGHYCRTILTVIHPEWVDLATRSLLVPTQIVLVSERFLTLPTLVCECNIVFLLGMFGGMSRHVTGDGGLFCWCR